MNASATLSIRHLRTHFFTTKGIVKSVDDISLDIYPGEILGLVGESGSGKSMTGFSILKLIDPPGRIVSGEINFKGQDLTKLDTSDIRQIRGKHISMIFQDPMMTLNPVLQIGTQMIETLHAHKKMNALKAKQRCIEVLNKMGIPSPEDRLKSYPHQLSGGMRQRIAIAIALLHQPDLIIADEPTTALDVTIQAQILSEIQQLSAESGTSLLWISHDLALVAGLVDFIYVMYAGKIVESGTVNEVLDHPQHPYTEALIRSMPSFTPRGEELFQIPGMAPSPIALPEGCAFHPRCTYAQTKCQHTSPELIEQGRRSYRCHFPLQGDQT